MTKCDDEVALACSVNAKNSPINYIRLSPDQLAFGLNPNLPNNMNNVLLALEVPIDSYNFVPNISALHITRKPFVSTESSEKLEMTLKKNTGNYKRFHKI